MNVFIIKAFLVLGLAAGISAAGAAAYAWEAAALLAPGGARPQVFGDLLPICLLMAGLSAAGGLYSGLRIAWARRARRRTPGSSVPLALGLLALAPILWIVTLTVPLCLAVGGLTALAAARLLGPGSFPLTPRSR